MPNNNFRDPEYYLIRTHKPMTDLEFAMALSKAGFSEDYELEKMMDDYEVEASSGRPTVAFIIACEKMGLEKVFKQMDFVFSSAHLPLYADYGTHPYTW